MKTTPVKIHPTALVHPNAVLSEVQKDKFSFLFYFFNGV